MITPLKKWIFLPVEVKTREFFPKLILAGAALRRGFGVFLGRNGMNIGHERFPSGIYFDKCLSVHKTRFHHQQVHELGNHLVSLDEEGLLIGSSEQYVQKRVSKTSFDMSSLVFAWGENQKNDIVREKHFSETKIILSGSPRIDAWRPPFIETHSEKARLIRKEFGNFILVVSNWGLKQQEKSEGIDPHTNCDSPRAQRRVAFIRLIDKLAAAFPSRSVVVRPHPQDLPEYWDTKAKTFSSNVKVVKQFSIGPWIQAASIIIHNNCTTGLEAWFGGRNVIAYSPRIKGFPGDFNSYTFPINELGIICRSEAEVIDTISTFNDGFPDPSKIQKTRLVSAFVSFKDDQLASEKIIDHLASLSVTPESYALKHYGFSNRLIHNARELRRSFYDLIGISDWPLEYEKLKNPGMESQEIRMNLRSILRLLNEDDRNLVVHQTGSDCFCIFLNP